MGLVGGDQPRSLKVTAADLCRANEAEHAKRGSTVSGWNWSQPVSGSSSSHLLLLLPPDTSDITSNSFNLPKE